MSHIITSSISRLALVPSLHIGKGIQLTRNRDVQVNNVMEQRKNAFTLCICVSTYTVNIHSAYVCQHTQSRPKTVLSYVAQI